MTPFAVAVSRALGVQAVLEAHAAGSAARLARCPMLTPEERDKYGDLILPDERRHARLCREWARSLDPRSRPLPPGIVDRERDDLERLVAMVTAERLFLRDSEGVFGLMGGAGEEVRQGLVLLAREERPHVSHGMGVLRRLAGDPVMRGWIRVYRRRTLQRSRQFMAPLHTDVVRALTLSEGR